MTIGRLRARSSARLVVALAVLVVLATTATIVVLTTGTTSSAGPARAPTAATTPAPSSQRAVLGIAVEQRDGQVIVVAVAPGGPAVHAGIRVGDRVVSVDSRVVNSVEDVRAALADHHRGDTARVLIARGGRTREVSVKLGNPSILGALPAPSAQAPSRGRALTGEAVLGVSVEDVTPALKQQYGFTTDRGAVIVAVEPGSAAAVAGLKQGDVIVRAGGRDVASAADLRAVVREHRPGDRIEVTCERGGQRRQVEVSLRSTSGATSSAHQGPGFGGFGGFSTFGGGQARAQENGQ